MKSTNPLRSTRRATSLSNHRFINRVSLTIVLLLAVAGVLIYVDHSRAAGGDIDPAFNAGGTGANSLVNAVAVQPDGKIVIGGFFQSYNGDAAASDRVMRLNADGTRDPTFNAGGAGADSGVLAVAVQPDGKIVIGGQFISYNGDAAASDFVMRLNADGTRDTTFNAGGAGANSTVNAVAVQPDGTIVIGGPFISYNGDAAASDRVMRLNADGTRDTTFNAGGAGADNFVWAVAVQPDGKIVIGGDFTSYNGDAAASDKVMRLNADGTRDTTFNAGGAGADGSVRAVAVQPDGKIVIGGAFTIYNGDAAASDDVMRLNADGTRDTTFNAGGAGANSTVNAVAVQPDGKIVIGGQFTIYNGDAAASDKVMRLKADGTRDTTFNAGGAGADSTVFAVAVQADGKIVIGGSFTSYNGDVAAPDFVIRLLPAPGALAFSAATYDVYETDGNATITVKRTGGTDNRVVGKVTLTDVTTSPADYRFTPGAREAAFNAGGAGANGSVVAVAVQADGKIVIGGGFTSYNLDAAASDYVMRLNTDGTRDTNFNAGGAGANNAVNAVAEQADGKIVIGGNFTSYNGDAAASDYVMRLNADGTRDTTFNTGGAGTDLNVLAVAVQPDGKIVIGGFFQSYNGDAAASDKVMRLNADGMRDTNFNAGGPGANSTVVAVAVQPDGKIVIGGVFTIYNLDAAASDKVMRLNADGTRDTNFNAGGAGANNTVVAVAVQPDGKIVIGGQFTSYNLDAAASDDVMRLDGDLFVTWPAGDATDKIILLPIVNDGIAEGNETLTLTLAVMSGGATLGSPSSSTLTIHDPPTPTITFGATPAPTFGGGNFTVNATTTNTDSPTLTYSRVSGPCAFVSGATFSSSGAGTCVVQASGAATTNFNAASNTQNVTIAKASQTITFGALANKTFGDPDFTVSATASSTLTVSFTASGQCTMSGNTAHLTGVGSCTITAAQAGDSNYNAATNVPQSFSINPQGGFISFSAANYNVSESTGFVTLTVNRSGDTTAAVTVDYATNDTGAPVNCATFNGLASARCDFTTAIGTLKFAAGETQKTIVVVVNKDGFVELPNEVFSVNLSNLTGGAAFTTPSSATVTIADSAAPAANAIDDTDTFVRQQYHDFLNREPDASGLAFWKDQIDGCTPKPECTQLRQINVSAAFFLSIEFQQSGEFVRDFYVATLDRPLTNNMPNYAEFIRDTQAVQRGIVVGQGSWQADLDANRSAFMNAFVMRAEFVGLYPTTDTPTQYVDKLIAHAAITLTASERSAAIGEFGTATTAADPGARGRALLRITQNTAFQQREINRAFVHMQYLGYLRRDPNAAPDTNFNGYNFWLAKLIQFNGNFVNADMVKAFITSGEYRGRFGP